MNYKKPKLYTLIPSRKSKSVFTGSASLGRSKDQEIHSEAYQCDPRETDRHYVCHQSSVKNLCWNDLELELNKYAYTLPHFGFTFKVPRQNRTHMLCIKS